MQNICYFFNYSSATTIPTETAAGSIGGMMIQIKSMNLIMIYEVEISLTYSGNAMKNPITAKIPIANINLRESW